MEIKIGIENISRELSLNSDQSRDELVAAYNTALSEETGQLTLVDSKGRQIVVPAKKIAYIEFGAEQVRQVGFGAI